MCVCVCVCVCVCDIQVINSYWSRLGIVVTSSPSLPFPCKPLLTLQWPSSCFRKVTGVCVCVASPQLCHASSFTAPPTRGLHKLPHHACLLYAMLCYAMLGYFHSLLCHPSIIFLDRQTDRQTHTHTHTHTHTLVHTHVQGGFRYLTPQHH